MYEKRRVYVLVLVALLLMPWAASAEWNVDLYGGGAFTQNTKGTQTSSDGTTFTSSELKVDNSFTAGGRVGYWLESLPWYGFGLDAFYFEPDIPTQTTQTTVTSPIPGLSGTRPLTFSKTDISVVGIGFDILRLRAPLLKSADFQHGRLQPYLTAGPALFLTKVKPTAFLPAGQSETDTSIGVKVGAGLSFNITKALALFGEYRFTHFKADATFQETRTATQEKIEATFNTHHVIGGISFRF
jgi:opacity protein-like surface antigen